MKYAFSSSVHTDWKRLAELDPSITTYRHCTSEDMRRLTALVGWDYVRVKRAFNLRLFKRTKYLTLSLDPSFEPKPEVRERAKGILEKRARKKEHVKIMRKAAREKERRKLVHAQSALKSVTPTTLRKTLLSRYQF